MPKTSTEQMFDTLVSGILWPPFKSDGFKKSGYNFRWYDASGWGKIVNFQKSVWYDKEQIHFTINTGLYLPEVELLHCGAAAKNTFLEPACVIRKRIGALSGSGTDLWFDLMTDTPFADFALSIQRLVTAHVRPWLDSISTRQDIFRKVIEGHRTDYRMPALEALYKAGFAREARSLAEADMAATGNNVIRDDYRRLLQSFG